MNKKVLAFKPSTGRRERRTRSRKRGTLHIITDGQQAYKTKNRTQIADKIERIVRLMFQNELTMEEADGILKILEPGRPTG